ncbi:hypothetical protein Micbo1qcDRAFT_167754 [Microdochium bolleyi]|uniref:Uncharacterized protein n=1 Tax=Microdochium bolleyi TaxID=196109 RepID=A0A136IQ42_9PEZI|nr:hypothetical protein Micbo1qcDRAFT_167754 [Microdochium bolleyi]
MGVPEDIEMDLSPTSYSFATAATSGLRGSFSAAVDGGGAAARPSMSGTSTAAAGNAFAGDSTMTLLGTTGDTAGDELLYHGQLDNNEYSFSRINPAQMPAGSGSGGLGLMNMDDSNMMGGGGNAHVMRNSSMQEGQHSAEHLLRQDQQHQLQQQQQQQQDAQPPRSSVVDHMW